VQSRVGEGGTGELHYAPAVPFLVRLRPTAAYLGLLTLGAALAGLGAVMGGFVGGFELAVGAAFVLILGAPLLISTVFRAPVLAVDDTGVRLPMMGVRLSWAEVADVRPAVGPTNRPVLLIRPADPQSAVRQMRPWVRSEGRTNITRYGTPIMIPEQSVDHTVAEMLAAVTRFARAWGSEGAGPP
jgi:hypothetical protein